MRRLVAALGLLALGAGRSGAQGTFLVGAARVDVTPPPFDAAADAAMFFSDSVNRPTFQQVVQVSE